MADDGLAAGEVVDCLSANAALVLAEALSRKPRILVAIAFATKMARTIWAMSQKWCRCSRQPDITDAQWLQRLHSFGLSRASFRPKGQIAELRSYVRQRERLIGYAASHIKHMHKNARIRR
ncbi:MULTISPECIES: hypothetical protein [unclassified Bradyrhizobium]|uniref:hypothetical protein n=1 Tax=unclassified Bradyrhizobium TaxID=2631580 RepID=UPI001FFA0FE8|nr:MULTISPECIES: hypothetical protein [unclassified Bradyrhizobium]MCK1419388.1 hypothetical protein [Bradyrhizobium sp. CW12]MCK1643491.1 hypothetical protein [Bradyrhizobium sp. 154]